MKVDNSKNKLKYWLPLIIFGIIIAAINFVSIIFTRNIDLKLATIGISIIAILLFLRFPRIRIILFIFFIAVFMFYYYFGLYSPSLTLEDCFVGVHIVTWIDTNQNGVMDEGEPPLPGVVCSGGQTDENGKSLISLHPGCAAPTYDVIIHVIAPRGYQPTTPTSCTAEFGIDPYPNYIDLHPTCYFGFIKKQD